MSFRDEVNRAIPQKQAVDREEAERAKIIKDASEVAGRIKESILAEAKNFGGDVFSYEAYLMNIRCALKSEEIVIRGFLTSKNGKALAVSELGELFRSELSDILSKDDISVSDWMLAKYPRFGRINDFTDAWPPYVIIKPDKVLNKFSEDPIPFQGTLEPRRGSSGRNWYYTNWYYNGKYYCSDKLEGTSELCQVCLKISYR